MRAAPHSTEIHQAEIWHGAIQRLDASEMIVRDTIERGLSAVAGRNHVKLRDALVARERVMAVIAHRRVAAVKDAFRHVRAAYDGSMIGDRSLTAHAAITAKVDVNRIDSVIRSGLSAGLTSTDIARRVVGSASLNGTDGATEMTRQHVARLGLAAIAGSPRTESGE